MKDIKEKKDRKLLDEVREHLRVKHYSYNTEKAYIYRIREFILFHKKRHPRDMGAKEIKTLLCNTFIGRWL